MNHKWKEKVVIIVISIVSSVITSLFLGVIGSD